jgi:MFS family permease
MAPKGKVGLYLGYSYLRSFIANAAGAPLTGKLVERYVPETGVREPYKMWFTFAAIGAVALVALFAYQRFAANRGAGEEGTSS